MEQEEREAAAQQAALDQALMPPPAGGLPRTVNKIADDLNNARADGKVADAERLEEEMYRALAKHSATTGLLPRNAQEKCEMLRSIIMHLRGIGITSQSPALEREYRRVFELVSFQFDDPAQQMAVYLGLQR